MNAEQLQPKRSAPAAFDKAEMACRVANVAWAIIAARLPYRSAIERIHALEEAGLTLDDVNFPRIASGLG